MSTLRDRSAMNDGQPLSAGAYIAISAGGLLVAVALLLLLVFGAERIIGAGLDQRVYYVLLVPLGLSAAAFAFGAMQSTGIVRTTSPTEVRLGGPAAFAALVVVGGFFLLPEPTRGTLAVRVDRPVANGGGPVAGATVRVDRGPQRLTQPTDAAGQASFLDLALTGSELVLSVEAEGYEPLRTTLDALPVDRVVRLELNPRSATTRVTGTVLDRETRAPLAGVVLSFASGAAVDTTDPLGNFGVTLDRPESGQVTVIGTRDGVVGLDTFVPVQSDPPLSLLFGR